MVNFINDYYLWLKACHLISVFAWMAGLFYLPRLFVYHVNAVKNPETNQMLKVMEARLLRYIMNPAMIFSWIFGSFLVVYHINSGTFTQGWLHTKLLMVVLITIFHHVLAYHRKKFDIDANQSTEKYFRLINEIPTVLMIVIVICVIVQPF